MSGESRPFYWVQPEPECDRNRVAPTGWYQWTKSGLKYLGESILEPAAVEHKEQK